ncbi:DUF2306 domain-containing protein [Iodobacter fluviatilis]|uniref:Membrane protein n=1 Tax=Iodobacter fluviatilis TaxID=537 RepID=A0A377SXA3_9NEIS|nr:DUF2306 domain-containing protein [Iodobacter fluviatilis]TCU88123.1 putative membrane protein [Iodobacter fluviatilis]STR45623.1 Predicted membrane protein (DUF2306) [Iodobacter fluviatilis]
MSVMLHLFAAFWVLIVGALQIARPKGTSMHKALGKSWMLAMLLVAVSSFWIKSAMNVFMGYGPIHLLSLWVLVCVCASIHFARQGNIKKHKGFAVGAFYGAIGAGLAAVAMPGRLLHVFLFG